LDATELTYRICARSPDDVIRDDQPAFGPHGLLVVEDARERIRGQIGRDFSASNDLGATDSHARPGAQSSGAGVPGAFEEMEAVRARGRKNWLKMSQQARTPHSDGKSAGKRDVNNEGPATDSGLEIDDDTPE
jgi:hypothetical protein